MQDREAFMEPGKHNVEQRCLAYAWKQWTCAWSSYVCKYSHM